MTDAIRPTTLPPLLMWYETALATWLDSVLAATDQALELYSVPFQVPHSHHALDHDQLDIPEPLELDHEHDLFA